ncbi:RNA polymerase factor sigma-54 [Pararhizobium haloflavum]|uniref:RNA polymerase factor sigma-54 n=1 Tax=Pararhizobium haloflavum TaxID=2037914 RepID=UPI000C17BC22|nr:RNA polymerase factor sigma-54 [Pararhizobium haloflavum]
MALSASLQLRQAQSLVMTPQLIQSIRLLQLTHLELNRFIEQEVERNPLLELANEDGEPAGSADRPDVPFEAAPASDETDWAAAGVTQDGESLSDRLDTTYENVFPDDSSTVRAASPELLDSWKSMPGGNGAASSDVHDLDEFVAGRRTLRDHVAEQIALTFRDPADRLIAAELSDHLDEVGYIAFEPETLAARLGVCESDLMRVLGILQQFEPPGLFARSLAECLALQLAARDRLDPAMTALLEHLDLLARRDFAALRRICGVDDEDLIEMLAEIRALDPKPGLGFDGSHSETITPDVIVRPSADGKWHVELSSDALPRVLVNRSYYAEVSTRAARSEDDQAFLADCLQSANWLTRSLDQRAKTIMKVASEIVRQQDAFLMNGVTHLRPLNLRAVADAIGMHESTVSRVTSNKYMMTPRGIFELKYFFTVSIASSAGGDAHSAEAVRQSIREMIAREEADAVLSDDDIVKALKAQGVELARRTVAKYRESMAIASSVQRRREKRVLAARAAG